MERKKGGFMSTMKKRKVLVLNKCWTAIGVANLQRAITLLFSSHVDGQYIGEPKARIIDPALDFQTFTWEDWSKLRPKNDEDVIKGIGADFRVPEIIMLTQYDKLPQQRVHFSRKTIYRRDSFTCQYCKDKLSSELLTIDHILPRAKGGQTTWENCVLACVPCNKQKADRMLSDAYRGKKQADYHPIKSPMGWKGPSPMKLLSVPKKPKFSILRGDKAVIPKSWEHFVSLVYWQIELENDNPSED